MSEQYDISRASVFYISCESIRLSRLECGESTKGPRRAPPRPPPPAIIRPKKSDVPTVHAANFVEHGSDDEPRADDSSASAAASGPTVPNRKPRPPRPQSHLVTGVDGGAADAGIHANDSLTPLQPEPNSAAFAKEMNSGAVGKETNADAVALPPVGRKVSFGSVRVLPELPHARSVDSDAQKPVVPSMLAARPPPLSPKPVAPVPLGVSRQLSQSVEDVQEANSPTPISSRLSQSEEELNAATPNRLENKYGAVATPLALLAIQQKLKIDGKPAAKGGEGDFGAAFASGRKKSEEEDVAKKPEEAAMAKKVVEQKTAGEEAKKPPPVGRKPSLPPQIGPKPHAAGKPAYLAQRPLPPPPGAAATQPRAAPQPTPASPIVAMDAEPNDKRITYEYVAFDVNALPTPQRDDHVPHAAANSDIAPDSPTNAPTIGQHLASKPACTSSSESSNNQSVDNQSLWRVNSTYESMDKEDNEESAQVVDGQGEKTSRVVEQRRSTADDGVTDAAATGGPAPDSHYRCVALFDFKGQGNELRFKRGALLTDVCAVPDNPDWLLGTCPRGRRGLFPTEFVQRIAELPSSSDESD